MAIANPERGEVDLDVGGKTYTLKLSMNAAAALQGRHKKSIGQLLQDASALDFEAIRSIVWLLLQKHHASEIKTETDAGNFIDDAGGIGVFFDSITRLGQINADPSPNGQPPAVNGTGPSSISAPDASA